METVIRHGREWLEKLRQSCSLRESQYYWFLRPERGGVGGRLHLHALVVVRPCQYRKFFPHPGVAPEAHTLWGRGYTVFRRTFDGSDPATEYAEKVIHTWVAEAYERERMSEAQYGLPSPALVQRAGGQVPWQTVAGEAGRGRSALATL